MTEKKLRCAWPRCKTSPTHTIPIVGENSGRIHACAEHKDRIAIGKAVIGTAAIAGFREGMDRAMPGVRERIGTVGASIFDLLADIRSSVKKSEPTP